MNIPKGFRHVFEGNVGRVRLPDCFPLLSAWGLADDLDGRSSGNAHRRLVRVGKRTHWLKTKAFPGISSGTLQLWNQRYKGRGEKPSSSGWVEANRSVSKTSTVRDWDWPAAALTTDMTL